MSFEHPINDKRKMIEIRKSTVADCDTIRSIAEIAFPETYARILTKDQIDYMMEWMYSIPNLEKQMLEEGHIYYLAFEEGKPVGYVSIQQEGADLFHLQKIYVLPEMQGKGVGKKLFERAVEAVKELHPEKCSVELNVNRENGALHFYEKMGMKKLRSGDFDIGNGYYMNDYIMGLEVGE